MKIRNNILTIFLLFMPQFFAQTVTTKKPITILKKPITTKTVTSVTTKITTTKPVAPTKPTGLPSSGSTNTKTAAATLSSYVTGNSFVFTNGTLTEYLDPTGIFVYVGSIDKGATDYFVAMPDYLFHLLLQNVNESYPPYSLSTGVLEVPGQKLWTTVINPLDQHKQRITHVVSLVTGNCYQCDPHFTPGTTSSTATSFTNKGPLHNLSTLTTSLQKGPVPGMFATYAPYPNFQGRLCQQLALSVEAAIKAFNATTSQSQPSLPTSLAKQPRFLTTKTDSLGTQAQSVYQLENITLTEKLDPSGVYVYQGTWKTVPTANNSYKGADYFIFTTAYLFSQFVSNTSSPVSYNYQTPTEPFLFPGQQLNKTYATPSTTSTSATVMQPTTIAISLVTGTCYQLIQNSTMVYTGFPALSLTTDNIFLSLKPMAQSSQLAAGFYTNYAPYQNFSGGVSQAVITAVTAAIKLSQTTTTTSSSTIATTVTTPATTTAPSGSSTTPFTIPTTFGLNSLGASTFTPSEVETASFATTTPDYDDESDDDDDDEGGFSSDSDGDDFGDDDDSSDDSSFDSDFGSETNATSPDSDDIPSSSDTTAPYTPSSDASFSSDTPSYNAGGSDQTMPSYGSSTGTGNTPSQPTSLLTDSETQDAEKQAENAQHKDVSLTSGKGFPLPFN